MRIVLVALFTLLTSVTPVVAAQGTPPFNCRVIAARQPLPGATVVDFRVVRMTFAAGTSGAMHRHKYGEIVYLLSGSGSSTSPNGAVTPLSSDRALVVAPNAYHKLTPTGKSALTVLSVQFPQRHASSYDGRPAGPDQCKP
jgi:quercetin dioxygenase-like cupin family protein